MRRLRPWPAGPLALLLALSALPFGGSPVQAATDDYYARCPAMIRTGASTSASSLGQVAAGSRITVSATVSGLPWSTTCVVDIGGSTWYAVTAIGGTSVASLYGVGTAYVATGMFWSAGVAPYVEGVDLSRWQGSVDFTAVRSSGRQFVIAKATEGIGYLDPSYATYRAGATAAGLAFSAYHFARPDLNPGNAQGEADWFVDTMGMASGMLVPALDIETAGTLSASSLQSWIGTFLARVYARTGVRPMIYTSPTFWRNKVGDTSMFADAGYKVLWVAHWGVSTPTVPANNWSNRGWTFWQYDNCGSVPGIAGCVDVDRFNGTDISPVVVGSTFSLSLAPGGATVAPGSSATFAIALPRSWFTMPVDLRVTGLPSGASATLSALRTVAATASVTVTTSGATPNGTFPITVSAIGGCWARSASVSLTVAGGAPTIIGPVYRFTAPASMSSSAAAVTVSWAATDPDGIASYNTNWVIGNGAWYPITLSSALARSTTQSWALGTSYRYATRATDTRGNTSAWKYAPTAVPSVTQQNGPGVSYSGSWGTVANGYALGGSLAYTTASGASATYSFHGGSVAWVAYRGPNRGSAAIYVDGVYQGAVSLYSSTYYARQVMYSFAWAASGWHTIRIVNLATAGHPRVDVDGFLTLTFF